MRRIPGLFGSGACTERALLAALLPDRERFLRGVLPRDAAQHHRDGEPLPVLARGFTRDEKPRNHGTVCPHRVSLQVALHAAKGDLARGADLLPIERRLIEA